MPQVPLQRFGWTFEQHWNAGEAPDLQQALYGVLDVLNTHRDMPPVEDVADLSTDGVAHEVRQRRLPVRNHRDHLSVIPTESPQVLAKLAGWRQHRLLNKAEAAALVVAFDLANHNIEVSLLVFRPASDMRAVQENRQCRCIFDARSDNRLFLRTVADVPGDFAKTIAHRSIHLFRARQEGFQDTRRFPVGMSCPKFGLKASQFRGRPIRKEVSKRRKRSAQHNIGFCIAGAAANARRRDLKPAEERVEHPRPIIMDGSHRAAGRTDPAGFRNFLDLVAQDRFLQLPKDRLRIFEQQPKPLRLRALKWAG